jgi:LPS sulfotransferase NodH
VPTSDAHSGAARGRPKAALANLLSRICWIVDLRSYLVCATQRSGSTLLCELLKGTRVAGRPEEYFEAKPDTGLPPLPGDPDGTVKRVLEHIGVAPPAGWYAAEPIQRQGDALSEEWVVAYHRDCAQRSAPAGAAAIAGR